MVNWLQIGQTSGTGDTYILIQADDNVSMVERSTTLTVSGITKHVNISVVQQGFEGEIGVTPTSDVFSYLGDTAYLTITANTEFDLYSKPNWISVNKSSGTTGTTSVMITYSANTETTARSGDIIWKCRNFAASATTHITQDAAPPYFNIGPMSINKSNTSGTSNVYISTNGSWTVTSASNWFTVAPTAGTKTSTGFTVTFNENQTAGNLTGTVVVRHNESGDLYTIDVTQTSAATVGVLDLVYSATSTTQTTSLYVPYYANNLVYMEIDGGATQQAATSYQFSRTGLHNVKFYLSDSYIAPYTFQHTNLVSVNISNVDTLGYDAFAFCEKLTGVTCSNITHIDTGSLPYNSTAAETPFFYCSALTEFNGANAILNGKGFAVGNTFVSLANGYTSFDTSVLPNNVTVFGSACLSPSMKTLSSVTVNTNITELRRCAFAALTKVTAITFNNNTIQNIPIECFDLCTKLTKLVLPDSVRTIEPLAAIDCFTLTAVTFGTQLQYIDYGFNMAPGNTTTHSPVKNITCRSTTAPTILSSTFFCSNGGNPPYISNLDGTVHYPAGSDYSSWQNSEPFVSHPLWTFTPDAT